MSKESRAGYEFRKYAKQSIDRKNGGRCALTQAKKGTHRHHLLPIWMAKEYVPDHDKRLIRSGHNGLKLRGDIHQELHDEMSNWPDWVLANFAVGMYAYLEEEYYKSALPGFAPEHVGHRQLTDNPLVERPRFKEEKEVVVYAAAAGD